jgi:hypothetical protein
MSDTRTPTRLALALLAATCLTPVGAAQAAPGDRIGPEFQVNTTTIGTHRFPSVAMDARGNFIVAWKNGSRIHAQRYNAAGQPQGAAVEVATDIGTFNLPSIAMDADGGFVVVWNGTFARLYDAAGEPQGPAFRVENGGRNSTVAMDTDGDFVIAWPGNDGDGWGVFARRYDAEGVPQGTRFRVNSPTTQIQNFPSVAMNADGDFVVTWQTCNDLGPFPDYASLNCDVFARRYDASGAPQGGEFLLNTDTADVHWMPAVAMDADGDFVVAWRTSRWDEGYGFWPENVFARRFDAAGTPLGAEFRLNADDMFRVGGPAVAMDADGDFVVAWNRWGDTGTDQADLFARRYDASGQPQGAEFRVHTTNRGYEIWPSVAMDADGDFVVAWEIDGMASSDRVIAQRFDGAEHIAGDFDGDGKADLLWRNTSTGNTVVWLMDGETRLEAGSIGRPLLAWRIAGTGDFNGDGKADILWRNTTTGNAIVWQMNGLAKAAAQSIGAPALVWTVERLRDTDGDGLTDIVWRNAGTGTTVVWRMSGFTKVAAEPIGSVNSDWQVQ